MLLSSNGGNLLNNAHQKASLSYDIRGRLIIKTELGTEYLTKREIEILKCVLQGHSAKKIGLLLRISCRTVESYMDMLKIKFRCHRKNELITTCINIGFFKISFYDEKIAR